MVVYGVGGIGLVGGGGGGDDGGCHRMDPWSWPSLIVPSPHPGGGYVADGVAGGVADGCVPLLGETGFQHTRWRVVRSRAEVPPA